MVSFAFRGSENIPSHSSPYPSRKERVWRPPLSHISNVLSHTNPLQLVPMGSVQIRLCFNSSCLYVSVALDATLIQALEEDCCAVVLFYRSALEFVPADEMKSRSVLLNFLLSLSSALKYIPGTFPLHNMINLPLHRGGALSYADNSWLGTLFVLTLHCQV